MTPKIYVKSMKNQGYVADAFLERFGAALGCQMLDFGSQNLQHIILDRVAAQPPRPLSGAKSQRSGLVTP